MSDFDVPQYGAHIYIARGHACYEVMTSIFATYFASDSSVRNVRLDVAVHFYTSTSMHACAHMHVYDVCDHDMHDYSYDTSSAGARHKFGVDR